MQKRACLPLKVCVDKKVGLGSTCECYAWLKRGRCTNAQVCMYRGIGSAHVKIKKKKFPVWHMSFDDYQRLWFGWACIMWPTLGRSTFKLSKCLRESILSQLRVCKDVSAKGCSTLCRQKRAEFARTTCWCQLSERIPTPRCQKNLH